jgi:hypothetical protein
MVRVRLSARLRARLDPSAARCTAYSRHRKNHVGKEPMIRIEDYDEFGGMHWETGSLRNVLAYEGVKAPHTGEPFSEAMLLGLSGGVAVMVFVFEYEGYPPHVALGTRYPFDAMANVVEQLGVEAEVRQTSSQKKAVDNLLSALVVGQAPIVWADMFTLSYNGLPPSPFTGMMPIVVFEYDIEGEAVRVSDRAKVPLTTTTGELAEARAAQPGFKNRLMTVIPPEDGIEGFPAAVSAAIRSCASLYLDDPPKGSASNFGLAALDRWADLTANKRRKKSWRRIFADPADLYDALKAVYTSIQHNGTGGSASRPAYADFLDEAAGVLDNTALRDAGAAFRAAGACWDDLAVAALPEAVEPFGETRGLLDQSHRLFREQGNRADNERAATGDRLAALQREVGAAFPLDEGGIDGLLDDLADGIRAVREAEAEAVTALHEALG